MNDLKMLSDQALLSETKRLVREERETLANILRQLREIERRRLYCGHPSLHVYVVKELKYTDDEACRRVAAMRTFREVPEIECEVLKGDLSMTHIGIARSIFTSEKKKGRPFTPEKKLEVFEAISGLSTRQAKRAVLEFAEEVPARRDEIKPLAGDQNLAKFALSDETLAKIEKFKGRTAHKNPNPSMDELISQMADLALELTNPAKEPKRKVKKDTAAAVSRTIWQRDDGLCTKCSSEYAIQEDHRLPESMGGEYSVENMRLLCRSCNQRAAIEKFGQDKMDPYLSPAAPRVEGSP